MSYPAAISRQMIPDNLLGSESNQSSATRSNDLHVKLTRVVLLNNGLALRVCPGVPSYLNACPSISVSIGVSLSFVTAV